MPEGFQMVVSIFMGLSWLILSSQFPSQDFSSFCKVTHKVVAQLYGEEAACSQRPHRSLIAPSHTQLLPLLQFSAVGQGAWDNISFSGIFSLCVQPSKVCLDF